ncbi:hypothetical protein Q9L58_006674 [Maublancomyces gigas]|uniref:BTB domain-containing protein n=1 Tax=Discina gigas TaxID=1032678 RepID=A0ABR3GET2_9PEZI
MSFSKEIIEIDPRGDLILHVTSATGQRFLKVCSKVLCLTSPVFRTMLESPTFQEGIGLLSATPESPFETQLHDDHYESLLIVINAMHLRTRHIPLMLPVEAFYQLAIVCDKYDVAEIFLPWVKIWTGKWRMEQVSGEKWLVIAWVFKLGKAFEDVTKGMIYDSPLQLDFTIQAQERVDTGVVPDSVLRSVRTVRQKTADAVLSLALQEFERYQSSVESKTTVCQIPNNFNSPCNKACDSLALGTLMRCLFDAKLWPISIDTSANIRSVLNCFISMDSLSNFLSSSNHNQCCPSKRLKPPSLKLLEAMEGLKLSDFCQPEEIFVPK